MPNFLEYQLFLSHSSKDKEVVRKIAEWFRKRSLKVWLDEWAIKPGDNIALAIEKGLQSSKIFVLCISKQSFDSDWVKMERAAIQYRDPVNRQRRFIPLLLDECPDLPETIASLRYLEYHTDPESALEAIKSVCLEGGDSFVENEESARPVKPTVLFVDDEDITRRLFTKQVKAEFTVYDASTVEGALTTLKEKHAEIAVIVTDQRLPRRRGLELLAIAKRDYPRIMRVLVSAYSDFDDLVDSVNLASVQAFIYKPWEPDNLKLVLRTAANAHLKGEKAPAFSPPLAIPSPSYLSPPPANNVVVPRSNDDELRELIAKQAKMLETQAQKLAELEARADRTENRDRVATEVPAKETSSPSLVHEAQASQVLINIASHLEVAIATVQLDYPGFLVFRNRYERKLNEIRSRHQILLRNLDRSKPIAAQPQVVAHLVVLHAFATEATDAMSGSYKFFSTILEALPAFARILHELKRLRYSEL